MLHYALCAEESVILDDAAAHSAFGEDPYIRKRQTRSILFLPLINKGKINGVVYLENNLTRSTFSPARIAVLKLLASRPRPLWRTLPSIRRCGRANSGFEITPERLLTGIGKLILITESGA
jgi:GAF domain